MSKHSPLSRLAYGLALCAGSLAHAQTQPIDAIVVTATRDRIALNAQSRDVTIITRESIESSGASSLGDLLRAVSGVQFTQNGGPGATSGLFLRGANTNHTLVLIDGQRVGSSTSGVAAIEAIALGNIERIEIVRGPASTLYGADALGGVVQVFTRSGAGKGPSAGAQIAAGTQRSAQTGAYAGFADGAWSTQLSGQWSRSAGFGAINNEKNFSYNADIDGYRRAGATASIAYQIDPQMSLRVRVLHNDLNAQYDGGEGYDDRTLTKQSALQLSLNTASAQLRASVSEDASVFDSQFPGMFRTRTSELSGQRRFVLSPQWSALGAIEWRGERVATSEGFAENTRNTLSALASLQGAGLNFTGRVDHNKQFGTRATGSAGGLFALSPQLQLTANLGTAFKAPTFNDLYYPGFSNPDLRAERAVSGDLGLRLNSGALSGGLTAHASRVTDIIVFICDANFNCAPENVRNAAMLGLSANATWKLDARSQLSAHLDWLDAKDRDTDNQLPRRARVHASVRGETTIVVAKVHAELIHAGKRFDDPSNKNPLRAYTVLNVGLDHPLGKGLTFELRGLNLTNEGYALAKDFASAPRSVMAGIRWAQ